MASALLILLLSCTAQASRSVRGPRLGSQGLRCGGPGPWGHDGPGSAARKRRPWAPAVTWDPGEPEVKGGKALQQEEGSLITVATYNSNCWRRFLRYVKQTEADIVVGQEVGVAVGAVAEAQSTLAALGWSLLL
eukprot:2779932-Lingulodinium_polyedra.AAC.1